MKLCENVVEMVVWLRGSILAPPTVMVSAGSIRMATLACVATPELNSRCLIVALV